MASIKWGVQQKLFLGNLGTMRDCRHARDFVGGHVAGAGDDQRGLACDPKGAGMAEPARLTRKAAPQAGFAVASNPELLREGAAIDDFKRIGARFPSAKLRDEGPVLKGRLLRVSDIVGPVTARISSYAREVAFVLHNSCDWPTRFVFLKNIARFHASNIFGRPRDEELSFHIRLCLARDREVDIVVRTFSGDLFALFEVLMDRCYYLPKSVLPSEQVRVILDCGANIGMAALYFASRYPNARIYSLEPSLSNFELLVRNTAVEPRIVPIHGAVVGSPRAFVHFTTWERAWGNYVIEKEEGLKVPAVTIDQLLEHHGLSHVDLLKVDIEGGEKEVFANSQFISRVGLVMIELHNEYKFNQFAADIAPYSFHASTPYTHRDVKMVIARPLETERVGSACNLRISSLGVAK